MPDLAEQYGSDITSLRSCAADYEAADGKVATTFGNLQGELDGR